ncbi:glycosyltransferase family 2 protein [Roseovarius faecimaris]|uniref:Glycosyltransferase family 2 protein n=1 Tax=Roseovarius faecimaris TaxID=2494550 RepID=A0A6I6IJS3_9RHOB|nr:glycosyltransferase family 2 protein [Roseovarius faecimaris]QGX97210.1 glycosyltransferase family 2 protein [Roseovarius faecimaris]
MSSTSNTPPSDSRRDWQLPAHEITVFGPKQADYALVIPVINEGEKIRNQLREFEAVQPPVDLVVADGGSTDGSLNDGILDQVGARALLTKTGSGKLSAQLRMAYAWCLDEGYSGIVTMDGNGKDRVDQVHRFVTALKDGADYAQGSRYATGGRAMNTPLDRELGNRFVHAPILSLAGGKRLTDTTNGFRAYSWCFLLDPKVAPFREVFSNYELLFYLTKRAGQLGYAVTEVPVDRSYPDAGPTPTKISGFRARWTILCQTLAAACGRYDP